MNNLTGLSRNDKIELLELYKERDRRRALAPDGCVFFIENYLKTFDPRPEAYPHHLDFKLYPFQVDYVNGLIEAIRVGQDIFDEKSRDMGVSWLALAVRFWLWICEDGYQGLLGSRKEDYVDNSTLDSLFGKLDYFIDNIKDPDILPKGFDRKKHRTYMRLVNPVNGNVLKGESANPNFSRGGRYKDVFFDEFGFWPNARQSWTAAGDATRCRHAVTTPPDEPSFAKVIRQSGKIAVRTWHWSKHPHKDQAWYEHEKGRRTEDEVLHELDISWEYTSSGRPYPEVDKVPFGIYAYESTLPIYGSIDIGLDALSLGWYQPVRNSPWITLTEAYENTNRTIEWYYPFFGIEIDSEAANKWPYTDDDLKLIEQLKYWPKATWFGDPSGNQRHVESGISAYSKLASKGIYVQTNTKQNDWIPRRDETKRLLGHLRVNDTPGTQWWYECLKNARYPKREENSQSTHPITMPVHNWTSHHRTQTEFFAVNYKEPLSVTAKPQIPGWVQQATQNRGGYL